MIRPTQSGRAYEQRAETYARPGKYNEALADYRTGRGLGGAVIERSKGLAWFLATCPEASLRNGNEAVREAIKDCVRTGWKSSLCLDTLAAAYAETATSCKR